MHSSTRNLQQRSAQTIRVLLRKYALEAARLLWLGVTIAGLSAFLFALPGITDPYLQPDPSVLATLNHLGISLSLYSILNLGSGLLFVIVFFTVSGLIFVRKSTDWMALLMAFFLVGFGFSSPVIGATTTDLPPMVSGFVTVINTSVWFSLNALFYLFPDGHFSPRWSWIPLTLLAVVMVFISLPASIPFSFNNLPGWMIGILMIAGWAMAIYAQVYRYRKVSGFSQRQQTKWVVYGLVMSILAGLVLSLPGIIQPSLNASNTLYGLLDNGPIPGLLNLFIPISVGIAVLRYRLWDIDPIINRTLVYGLLTALIVGIYVATVSGLGLVFEQHASGLVPVFATALVAVLFQPIREGLQRSINHLMYGERDDPYRVLTKLGQRLETALRAENMLPGIVETVAHSLKLPRVALTFKDKQGDFQIAAVFPTDGVPSRIPDQADCLILPLTFQQETIGQLVLEPRDPDERFSPQDQKLLADLAKQIGIAVHSIRLTDELRHLNIDLQQSRERLVLAREEERRRIRRDLHDGLGPTLAALALSAGSMADLAATRPMTAAHLAQEMQQEIRASIADIRQLVYELRPPALDELGLVAAIRDRVAQIAAHIEEGKLGSGDGLDIQVDAPDSLTALPAAVEVAAYRIVLEALTNVVRHAQAHHCTISVYRSQQALEIVVRDDGIGISANGNSGVGLFSMRERANELGGTFTITPLPEGGTQVQASLPIADKDQ